MSEKKTTAIKGKTKHKQPETKGTRAKDAKPKIVKLPTERAISMKLKSGQALSGLEAGRGLVMTTINRLASASNKPFSKEEYTKIVLSDIANESTYKYYEHSLQVGLNLLHQDQQIYLKNIEACKAIVESELLYINNSIKLIVVRETLKSISPINCFGIVNTFAEERVQLAIKNIGRI